MKLLHQMPYVNRIDQSSYLDTLKKTSKSENRHPVQVEDRKMETRRSPRVASARLNINRISCRVVLNRDPASKVKKVDNRTSIGVRKAPKKMPSNSKPKVGCTQSNRLEQITTNAPRARKTCSTTLHQNVTSQVNAIVASSSQMVSHRMKSNIRFVIDRFVDDLTHLNQTHFIEMTELKNEYAKKIGNLKREHEESLKDLNQEHEESVKNLKIKFFEYINR